MSCNLSEKQRRAAIDVGTNSVKLLLGDVDGCAVTPILEESIQTRLGRGFYQTHLLQKEAIEATACAVAKFGDKARNSGAQSIRVIATSAARDALNAEDLIQSVFQHSGLKLEVISGEKEAEWAFEGVTTDPTLADQCLLLLDVGGGSSEFIVGERSKLRFRHSFRLGTVRMTEQLTLSDPPGLDALEKCRIEMKRHFAEHIIPKVHPALDACTTKPRLVGTGGTATVLARMEMRTDAFEREKIEALRIPLERVTAWTVALWGMPLASRQHVPGLPPNRADVILAGMVIYETIMKEFDFSELQSSTRGLRYSVLIK